MRANQISNRHTEDLRNRTHFFLKHLDITAPNECWNWKGAIATDGYGRFKCSTKNKTISAHRAACVILGGYNLWQLEDRLVMHTCDNRLCCNPMHLKMGTHDDNMADAKQKRRFRPRPRFLKEEDVLFIRQNPQISLHRCAELFNTTFNNIHRIRHYKTWKHI